MNQQNRLALALLLVLLGVDSASAANTASYVARPQATFAPHTHPAHSAYPPVAVGGSTFRWGWFGAEYYPPAPVMHRDYNRGWRQWHYRR